MNTQHRNSLLSDDRGAVMVMGIFMCSCLVGALWYLAGIGDAILYRERLQEAADAVAFSDAALHARGMNLLVLINLIMAVILGIRVAVRTAKIATLVAAAVFAAVGIVNEPLWLAAGGTSAAAEALDTIGDAIDPAIDGAVQALNKAQDGIAKATPGLARAAATLSVGPAYAPTVASSGTSELAGLLASLPVEHVDPKVLCKNAAKAFPDIGKWALDEVHLGIFGDVPLTFLSAAMGEIAGADPDYFCGLQSGGGGSGSGDSGSGGGSGGGGAGGAGGPGTGASLAAAIDKQLEKGAAERCKDLKNGDNDRQTFEKKDREWLAHCASAGVTCESVDAAGRLLKNGRQSGRPVGPDLASRQLAFELDRLRHERDQDLQSLTDLLPHLGEFAFDKAKCFAWAKADAKRRHDDQEQLLAQQHQQAPQQKQQQKDDSSQSSSSNDVVASMAVVSAWHNGVKEGQIMGGVLGDPAGLRQSARLVRIGTVPKKTPQVNDPEVATVPAWAQAEFFYDCVGKWDDCNGSDEEAMWHFKWRARLRRFNQPTDETFQDLALSLLTPPPKTSPDEFADKLAQDALGNGEFHSNASLRHDLSNSLHDQTIRSQGVH